MLLQGPEIVVPIAGIIMIIVLSIGLPLVRALSKRWDRDGLRQGQTPEIGARLERIEQAVDAIAVEVERISEGQRFTTKLLSDRTAASEPDAVRPRDQGAG